MQHWPGGRFSAENVHTFRCENMRRMRPLVYETWRRTPGMWLLSATRTRSWFLRAEVQSWFTAQSNTRNPMTLAYSGYQGDGWRRPTYMPYFFMFFKRGKKPLVVIACDLWDNKKKGSGTGTLNLDTNVMCSVTCPRRITPKNIAKISEFNELRQAWGSTVTRHC